MATITDIQDGDVLKIKGLNDRDEIVYWWAQKVGVNKKNEFD